MIGVCKNYLSPDFFKQIGKYSLDPSFCPDRYKSWSLNSAVRGGDHTPASIAIWNFLLDGELKCRHRFTVRFRPLFSKESGAMVGLDKSLCDCIIVNGMGEISSSMHRNNCN